MPRRKGSYSRFRISSSILLLLLLVKGSEARISVEFVLKLQNEYKQVSLWSPYHDERWTVWDRNDHSSIYCLIPSCELPRVMDQDRLALTWPYDLVCESERRAVGFIATYQNETETLLRYVLFNQVTRGEWCNERRRRNLHIGSSSSSIVALLVLLSMFPLIVLCRWMQRQTCRRQVSI